MDIEENINTVRAIITASCQQAGRSPTDVTLVAVSKTHPPEKLAAAVAAGLQHFGENRVEEAETKIPVVNEAVQPALTWHMIGHIQSRKAKAVVPLFDVVHSVDSLRLAERLAKLAAAAGRTLPIFLEVNISGEESKHGLIASNWANDAAVRTALWAQVGAILKLPGVQVRGLMTMAPFLDEMEATRPFFADLAKLRAALSESFETDLPDLSMGMTNDYPVAIEEGATIIRVGRAIFGERAYP